MGAKMLIWFLVWVMNDTPVVDGWWAITLALATMLQAALNWNRNNRIEQLEKKLGIRK